MLGHGVVPERSNSADLVQSGGSQCVCWVVRRRLERQKAKVVSVVFRLRWAVKILCSVVTVVDKDVMEGVEEWRKRNRKDTMDKAALVDTKLCVVAVRGVACLMTQFLGRATTSSESQTVAKQVECSYRRRALRRRRDLLRLSVLQRGGSVRGRSRLVGRRESGLRCRGSWRSSHRPVGSCG